MSTLRYFVLKNDIEKTIYIYITLLISTLIISNIYYLFVVHNFIFGVVLIYTLILLCILLENILYLRKWEINMKNL
jgi:hypothetical protein